MYGSSLGYDLTAAVAGRSLMVDNRRSDRRHRASGGDKARIAWGSRRLEATVHHMPIMPGLSLTHRRSTTLAALKYKQWRDLPLAFSAQLTLLVACFSPYSSLPQRSKQRTIRAAA